MKRGPPLFAWVNVNDSANRPTGTSSDVTFTAQQTISSGNRLPRSSIRCPISENGSDFV